MSIKDNALKAGIGYTVGNILIKGLNFLTLPLFSRIMTVDEFGIYNVFLSYDAILCVIVGMALHTSVKSAHYEFKDKTDEYISSISIVYIINTLLMILFIIVFGNIFLEHTNVGMGILMALVIYSFAGAVINLYNERISLSLSYKRYLQVSLLSSVGNITLSLILMYTICSHHKELGRILGATIALFVVSVILLFSFYKKSKPKINKKYWRFGIKYSLPIIPHGISQVLLGQFDRIMISNMVSNAAAGIYSLATNIKLILTIISTSLSTVWSTWFYSKIENREIKEIKKSANKLLQLFAILTIGLMAISPELIALLGGAGYEMGKYVAIPMIVDAFVLFAYSIIVPSEYYSKKTIFIMWGTIIATIINIVTNYYFVNIYGFIAAAYTTLFAYLCYLILHFVISYRLIRFNIISIKNILVLMGVISLSMFVDLFFVDDFLIRILYSFVIIVIIAYVVFKEYILDKINFHRG